MNIQIFGKSKCFKTKAAERFFSERKIKYQFIDILDKGLSKRELDNVCACVKDIKLLFDKKSMYYESLHIEHILRSNEDLKELLIKYPALIVTPVVRDCDTKKCTVGEDTSTWKSWI